MNWSNSRQPLFDPLEPRLLLSACPAASALKDLAAGLQHVGAVALPKSILSEGKRDSLGDTFADAAAGEFSRHGRLCVRGRINSARDADVVSIVAPASGTVHVELRTKGKWRWGAVSAFDAGGNLLAHSENAGRGKATLDIDVAAGHVYYLKITGSAHKTGLYGVRAGFTKAPVPVNRAPVAQDDAYAVDEDNALTVSPGVLANDTDPDGDAMTAALVDGVSNGTLTLNGDGSFTYTPNADFSGTDRFTYRANDGTEDSNVATVAIEVRPVNGAPVATNDTFCVDEDAVLTPGQGVLVNDFDAEGDPLTVELVSDVANGVLSLNADGTFTYTPDADFNGEDHFIYRVSDGTAFSNLAAVNITVVSVNDAPVAADDAFGVKQGESLELAPAGALANDHDVDGDPLTLIVADGPEHGTVAVGPDGKLMYTPGAGFIGTDTLTYRASDGTAESNVATVTITVESSNHAPVANDDVYTVVEGGVLTVLQPGILANDTDADGDMLFAMFISDVSHGSLSRDPLGGFTYFAAANFTGTDSFQYMAADQVEFSNVATVTINVVPA